MSTKKLLVFHPALAPYRVDFFNMLSENFETTFYFNLTNVADQKFDQDRLKAKCFFNINYLRSGFELFGRSFRTGIIKIIKKENPDIILCSEYGPVTLIVFIYKYFYFRNFKLYTLSDDSIHNSKSRKGFRAFLRNIISKNLDGVIFPSTEVCNWFKGNISSKTKTLELPIIHSDILFRNELKKSFIIANNNISRHKLEGKKVILYVGRLVKVKNLPFLIDALALLKNKDWLMIFIGDGLEKSLLINQVNELGINNHILFIGRKESLELLSWYAFSQIFVLPSTYERFGAVVNEALLGGCKVMCSEMAGASSLINSQNGCLFNPYSVQDFTAKLERLLDNTAPLQKHITALRESEMAFTFAEKVETLIANL